MPESFNNPLIHFHKVTQISETHCGPAVIQMLLSNIGIDISQEILTESAGASKSIIKDGMRIDEMQAALTNLQVPACLWYKAGATLNDIHVLLDAYKCPVGVEWQGLFNEDEEEDTADLNGHYSVITRIDDGKNVLIIADPYKDYADQDRIIDIGVFLRRWWDINWLKNPFTQKRKKVKDNQVLFVITPPDVQFPDTLKMVKATAYYTNVFGN